MNSKAIRKQLLAAVAMVLVAAVALGSSTYAWFVNNSTVTAEGMKVNATADDSLLISVKDANNWKSVETITTECVAMKPATSDDGVNFGKLASDVKVEASSSAAATWTGEDGVFNEDNLEKVTEAGTHYVENQFDLKAVGGNANVYTSEISLTTNNALFKAVRVSITIGNVTKVYNAGNGTNLTEGVGHYTGTKWELNDSPTYNQMLNSDTWEFNADTVYTATVRIWFEGQDVNCKSDNVGVAAESFNISFTKA